MSCFEKKIEKAKDWQNQIDTNNFKVLCSDNEKKIFPNCINRYKDDICRDFFTSKCNCQIKKEN